jgi:hypothetical protein
VISRVNQATIAARRERHLAMSPAERVALAERLGAEGLAAFMATSGLDRRAAVQRIKAANRLGRRPSASAVSRADSGSA